MLKVLIFDCGYGGEFFADRFEDEVNVVDVIRVIDWRHADEYLNSPKASRRLAFRALSPYIGKVDLIIFANHLLSLTSLRYFQRTFPNQLFLGFNLKEPDTFIDRGTLCLTTKAVTKTMGYHGFIFRLNRRVGTVVVDDWVAKIDDGELGIQEIDKKLTEFCINKHIFPREIILGCSQFEDIMSNLKRLFGRQTTIYSSFNDAIREACKLLRLRGGVTKRKS